MRRMDRRGGRRRGMKQRREEIPPPHCQGFIRPVPIPFQIPILSSVHSPFRPFSFLYSFFPNSHRLLFIPLHLPNSTAIGKCFPRRFLLHPIGRRSRFFSPSSSFFAFQSALPNPSGSSFPFSHSSILSSRHSFRRWQFISIVPSPAVFFADEAAKRAKFKIVNDKLKSMANKLRRECIFLFHLHLQRIVQFNSPHFLPYWWD